MPTSAFGGLPVREPGGVLSRRRLLSLTGAILSGMALSKGPLAPPPPPFGRAASALPGPGPGDQRRRFLQLVRCPGRRIHVSGWGDDRNPGTTSRPLRQISAAVGRAEPGDLLVVGSGTYGSTEVKGFRGSTGAWLGIMTADDSVRAVITVPPSTDNFVTIVDSSHVGLFGFEVAGTQSDPNTNGSGISVHGSSHHVAIWRNHVHDFPGGGINCFDAGGSHDMVDISYNIVHGTSRWSPWNTSGISIFASQDLTQGETFGDGYGYRVVGNYVFDVECLVPFVLGGYDCVTDGNAISLDKIAATRGYRKPILVKDNLLVACGGRAVHVHDSVNVDAIGNTAVGNMRTASPMISGRAELDGTTDSSVRYLSNVICPLFTDKTADATSTYAGNVILGGTQRVRRGNVDLRSAGLTYFAGPLSIGMLTSGPPVGAFAPRFDGAVRRRVN